MRGRVILGLLTSTSLVSMLSMKQPPPIMKAVSELDASIAPFLTSAITNLYGQKTPDEELIATQVEDYYLPMYSYLNLLLEAKQEMNTREPLFIGISAPQGCGKTTMTDIIKALLHKEGKTCVSISLDDFYKTGQEQEDLAKSSANELLKLRGNAGTHDLALLNDKMEGLRLQQESLKLPRYDKSLRAGKGDRAPEDQWDVVNDGDSKVDIVLFEGWMLGFDPIVQTTEKDTARDTIQGDMVAVNEYLSLPGYAKLHAMFDGWIVIAVSDINAVFDWRLDAEKRMMSSGKPGMTDAQVGNFVNRFLPAYKAYLPRLHAEGIGPQPRKTIAIDETMFPKAAMVLMQLSKDIKQTCSSDTESECTESECTESESFSTHELLSAPVLRVSIDTKRLPLSVDLI